MPASPEFLAVLAECVRSYRLDPRRSHGIAHWARVAEIGRRIAGENGGDVEVVELFAVLHDSQRLPLDGPDPGHGPRAAEFARSLRERGVIGLDDARFARLHRACHGHTSGRTHPDPTVGACWDADRLDLMRYGRTPNPDLLSTEAARRPEMIAWARQRAAGRGVPALVAEEWGIDPGSLAAGPAAAGPAFVAYFRASAADAEMALAGRYPGRKCWWIERHPLTGEPGVEAHQFPPGLVGERTHLIEIRAEAPPSEFDRFDTRWGVHGCREWFLPPGLLRSARVRVLSPADEEALIAGYAARLAARNPPGPAPGDGVVLYHRTIRQRALSIMAQGFLDQPTNHGPRGVYVSNLPVDNGVHPSGLFRIVASIDAATLDRCEWSSMSVHPYREWILPASTLNASHVRLLTQAEEDAIAHERSGRFSHVYEFAASGQVASRTVYPGQADRLTSEDWREILGLPAMTIGFPSSAEAES